MASILRKLYCITLDVTGTLIAYKLGDSFCFAIEAAGKPCPSYKQVDEGFKVAYAELAKKHFGFAHKIPNDVWWKTCVRDSFVNGFKVVYAESEETLHIRDTLRKNYLVARGVRRHALLLDRFKTADAVNWRKSVAIVLPDLTATKDWLTSEELK